MDAIGFLSQSERTAVKVCGVRSERQALDIAAKGVDALGVNFWSQSKRYIDPAEAQEWLPDVGDSVTVVGLFVNADFDEIEEHFENELFSVAQLHGDEDADFCQRLVDREIPFIKALAVKESADLGDLSAYGTRAFLLDAAQEGYGGGGISFDWNLAARIIRENEEYRFLLAGGIKPTTVAEAIRVARPAGVDVASGVETSPGMKDLGLVEDLVTLARKGDAS